VYRALLELDPSDAGLQRRFSQFLRDREQYSELAHVLSSLAESLDDPVERAELQRERARLLACNLESPQEARATWDQLAAASRDDSASRLAIAGTCLQSGDVDGYVSWRTEASSELPHREAALVLCHLAEALDEADAPEGRITGLYRQARQLDAACEPAREALKGIGRRRKDLRPEAALLPEDGEKQMPWSARAERMRMRAEAELTHDVAAAVEWLLRAVVTDMDDVAAWDALAEALESTGDRDGAYRARVGALEAIRRTRPLSAAGADEEAGRLLAIASAARAVGSPEEYERIIRRVHAVAPGHAPTALALASIVLERGEHEVARDTLDTLLSRYRERIPDSQLAQVHTVRARTYLAAGDADAAAEDFRNAIALSPLDRGALSEYATLLSERGQFAESIEHRIRALVVAAEPSTRAELHFALGLDWEDGLGAPNEAGVCFEHAWEEGLRSRALDQRLLGHFHRTRQVERGLAVIDGLLDSASEPGEMARLWMSRGEIFASSEGREDEAIEAFDMALSYDPDLNAARSALARVLERRGDWDGLLEILEAIAESDAGPADERAAATLEMARVASERLGDDARAMELVRAANDLSPSVEATRLEADLLGRTEHGSEAHLEALARLVALGPPWFEPAFSLGELVLDTAPSWGWCLLSPALVVRGVDDQLKAGLKGMRRDYERPPIRVVPEKELAADWPEELRGLRDVLSELVAIVPVGAQSIAELDEGDVATVSVHSNIGRTFLSVAEAFGVEGASVHRGGALVEPVGIAGGPEEAAVIIRADIFQQLSRAELGFALAYSLDLASPGSRALSASKAGSRSAVVRGLWGALGFAESRGDAAEIEAKIRDAVDPEGLEAWGARVANLSGESPSSVAERYWKAVRLRAMRAGLLAGADLTQVIRLVARMETDLERPALFEDADALDSYVAQVPLLGALVAFAASPRFGRWIAEAREV
jgi:tetratricopeptide (TPR) repeat protein